MTGEVLNMSLLALKTPGRDEPSKMGSLQNSSSQSMDCNPEGMVYQIDNS